MNELTRADIETLKIAQARFLRNLGGGMDPRVLHGVHSPEHRVIFADAVEIYDKLDRLLPPE